MKKTIIFLILSLLISCDNKDEIEVTPQKENFAKIEVYYQLQLNGKQYPDTDSDVFVYYGIYTTDIQGFDIDENGVLSKGSKVIEPNAHYKINSEGKSTFETKDQDEKITIIIRSNYDKNRISTHCWSNSKKGLSYTLVIHNNNLY